MSDSLPNGRAGHRIAILLVRVGVALTLSGQNLLAPRHAEFPDADHMQDQPSIFGKIAWRS